MQIKNDEILNYSNKIKEIKIKENLNRKNLSYEIKNNELYLKDFEIEYFVSFKNLLNENYIENLINMFLELFRKNKKKRIKNEFQLL